MATKSIHLGLYLEKGNSPAPAEENKETNEGGRTGQIANASLPPSSQ